VNLQEHNLRVVAERCQFVSHASDLRRQSSMTRSFEFIRLRVSARVAWLEFNRAPVNAFNREMVREVREAIAAALTDPEVRVLVLASAIAGYFSAGADLHEFEGMKARDMRGWVSICHEIARELRSSAKPLLAAINGTAVGGGLEMALHCDLRFAASDAKLGQPEIRIAFIPPIATTQALVRLLGRPRAIRYLYEGRMLDAAEALAWGLVDEIVEPGDLRRRVQRYAEDLAAKPAAALAAIRRTITLGGGVSFEDGMALELETATALADTSDFAEGVDAFLNKRAPRWSGS
jgi:enoyl-CoA hydratase/carnithine racemase